MDSASGAAARELRDSHLDDDEIALRRLLSLGPTALSEWELLALICARPAKEVHQWILEAGGLRALASRPARECASQLHAGRRELARVIASFELGRRVLSSKDPRPRLYTPSQIYEHLRPQLALLGKEVFHVLYFNARNVLIHEARVAEGCVDSCTVDPREVFGPAVAARSTAIVLAHNHPSGDADPSARDKALTEQLCAGGRLLGIQILDHLVIGDGEYTSMRERSWIRTENAPLESTRGT
jgi:DNA repair protein RadC